jgi:YesN/AraC family two-component response regulator
VLLFYPQVIYGVPISIVNENDKRMEKKQNLVQQNNEMFLLSQRVLKYFDTAQPYLKKNFTLDDLADELAVPKHQLYSCLNNYIEKRFTQLRTSFRVEHAKKLLLTAEIDSFSLNGIWVESGFSSRTNFFISFKEETGLTPIEFIRKQAKVQS